jgi:starch synthase
MAKKLKIASISAELSPFYKTGGLGDVAASLPRALKRLGHEVITIAPFYAQAFDREKYALEPVFSEVEVWLNDQETVKVNYWKSSLEGGVLVYFVENSKYFSRRQELYGSERENARFLIFDVAALKLLYLLNFSPDIIHCHDWHTGLIPYYFKTDFHKLENFKNAKVIYTIHNLAFQLGHNWFEVPDDKRDDGHKALPLISDPDIEYINFARRAILHADALTTVSETYREEILAKDFGEELHRLLLNRQDRLFGIVNGINEDDWNPANDPGLHKNYDSRTIGAKAENKIFWQKKLGLEIGKNIPLLCGTSRMTPQKGYELIIRILPHLFADGLEVILIGACLDQEILAELKKIAKRHPRRMVLMPTHEELLQNETMAYAASDLFLMPSYYEPCGINQLIAMRYGCVPIARRVGGLRDTVENYDPAHNRGSGFVFSSFNEFQFYGAVTRGVENFYQKKNWNDLVERIMKISHDWEIPARKYLQLFRRVIKWKE